MPHRVLALCALLLLVTLLFRVPAGMAQTDATNTRLSEAKRDIDRIASVRGDRERITQVGAFLQQYPNNYWRHVAYRLWLYSAWRLADAPELQKAADTYLAEHPDSAAAHGSVSRYFMEAGVNARAGLESARRSKELYELQLGLSESTDLRAVNAETRGLQLEADYLPPNRRGTFINYLGSRFNLARYELNAGQRAAALRLVEPVLELNPFTSEEDETVAPFYFVAGQAHESMGNRTQAYRHYLGAVVVGDSANRWASQAQSRLRAVGDELSDAERQSALRGFVPPALAGMTLPRFTDVTRPAGLANVQASRVAFGDVDNDFDADLLLDGSLLYINHGARGFADASETWGLEPGRSAGLFADVDNDGDLDLFVLGDGPRNNRLLRNDGGRFTDVTGGAGSATVDADCIAAGWLDANLDGWIDMYIAGYERGRTGVAPDMLLENTGTGVLRGTWRVAAEAAAGAGVSALDFNRDGRMDVFVANRSHPDNLWAGGEGGHFSDLAEALGLGTGALASVSSAGDWGDVNNNGRFDLFVTRSVGGTGARYARSSFYQAAGEGSGFTDVRQQKGIRGGSLTEPLFADFNNDGHLDLFLTTSGAGQRSYLYINDGQGGWHDYTYLSGARVFGGLGSAWADIDRDGDLDLLVCTEDGVRLLRNDTPEQNWLQVRCTGGMLNRNERGTYSNAAGIGAVVTLSVGGESFTRHISSGKGSGCGNELIAHFGLGNRSGRMSLTVEWPGGRTVTRALTSQNHRLDIREAEDAPVSQRPAQTPVEPGPMPERPRLLR